MDGEAAGEPEAGEHARPPVNQTPEALKDMTAWVMSLLQSYGWYLLLGLILVLYFKDRVMRTLRGLFSSLQRDDGSHRYDDGTALQRMEALEASRRRLQEQMDAQAALYAEEMKKKEEEKRAQKIEDWERHKQGKGYRSKYRPPAEDGGNTAGGASGGSETSTTKKKNVYRPADFNPLMGSGGGGAGFRPGRRGGGGGGG